MIPILNFCWWTKKVIVSTNLDHFGQNFDIIMLVPETASCNPSTRTSKRLPRVLKTRYRDGGVEPYEMVRSLTSPHLNTTPETVLPPTHVIAIQVPMTTRIIPIKYCGLGVLRWKKTSSTTTVIKKAMVLINGEIVDMSPTPRRIMLRREPSWLIPKTMAKGSQAMIFSYAVKALPLFGVGRDSDDMNGLVTPQMKPARRMRAGRGHCLRWLMIKSMWVVGGWWSFLSWLFVVDSVEGADIQGLLVSCAVVKDGMWNCKEGWRFGDFGWGLVGIGLVRRRSKNGSFWARIGQPPKRHSFTQPPNPHSPLPHPHHNHIHHQIQHTIVSYPYKSLHHPPTPHFDHDIIINQQHSSHIFPTFNSYPPIIITKHT